ncbi:MAG: hypothetical protein RIC56_14925 [Pseudomonadales bacterium]
MAEPGRLSSVLLLLRSAWSLFLLFTRSLQPILVVAVVALVAWALLSRQPWPYAIEAATEHVALTLAGDAETRWRIDGALLCAGRTDEERMLPVVADDPPCPGRRWSAYDLRGIEEVTLLLPAAVPGEPGYSVRIDVERGGALALALEPPGGDVAAQLFAGAGADGLRLAGPLLLRFPAPVEPQPARRILLPFAGAGSIGRDVVWHDPSLLRGGSVSVFTHSDEAAGGRDLVATTALLPGDRIDLAQSGEGQSMSKGFVHYDLEAEPEKPPALTVVAFGESDAIRIVRFGDQGYSFSPGYVARLSRHSAVATWAVLLITVLGFMAVYREGSEVGGEGSFRERRQHLAEHWRRVWRGA